jgi:hypothetical protein
MRTQGLTLPLTGGALANDDAHMRPTLPPLLPGRGPRVLRRLSLFVEPFCNSTPKKSVSRGLRDELGEQEAIYRGSEVVATVDWWARDDPQGMERIFSVDIVWQPGAGGRFWAPIAPQVAQDVRRG